MSLCVAKAAFSKASEFQILMCYTWLLFIIFMFMFLDFCTTCYFFSSYFLFLLWTKIPRQFSHMWKLTKTWFWHLNYFSGLPQWNCSVQFYFCVSNVSFIHSKLVLVWFWNLYPDAETISKQFIQSRYNIEIIQSTQVSQKRKKKGLTLQHSF